MAEIAESVASIAVKAQPLRLLRPGAGQSDCDHLPSTLVKEITLAAHAWIVGDRGETNETDAWHACRWMRHDEDEPRGKQDLWRISHAVTLPLPPCRHRRASTVSRRKLLVVVARRDLVCTRTRNAAALHLSNRWHGLPEQRLIAKVLMSNTVDQAAVDSLNSNFWSELCGTQFAKSIGVTDNSAASLKKFDDWYFAFYPYLFVHIPFEEMKDKNVLEIGLGYGTVSQRLVESGADYRGLDIASGPVAMVNHRLHQAGLAGEAQQGSILAAPFPDQSFDYVVAIGCLHHTGDLFKAIEECRRLLRPGGRLIFMVYYAYSYRRWYQARPETLKYLLREAIGYRGVVGSSAQAERAAYDANHAGEGAPHTDWVSIRSLRKLCSSFTSFSGQTENIDNGTPFERSPSRRELLKTWIPRWFGLDLYATATR